jgi:small-conductance mechanosensitive channel/CRP-like cAMP-binding protein
VLLFLAWAILYNEPRLIPTFGDLRNVFGKNLQLLHFAAFIPLIILVVRIVDTFAFDVVMSRRSGVSAPPLLRDIVAIGLYLIFFTAAYSQIFNKSVTTVLTGTTVIAAVLALAAQETLGNLFAGMALHLEDSFEVGDVIKSGDYIGTVETVSWRATKIRTFNNDIAILPNSVIARDRLEVHPRGNYNGRVLSVGLDWHVAPAVAIDILSKAAAHVEGVSREMPCFARVASFGDSSVTYDVKYFVRDYSQRDRIDADIRKAIWYAMRRNNIAVPFPIRAYQPYTPPESKANHDLPRAEVSRVLREVELLSPLSEEAHETIGDAAKVHFFSKGEAILRHGTAGDSMFIVHDGSVSVRVPDDDGSDNVHEVARLEPGSVFGEMALLTGEARTADVVALADVTTIEIGKSALEPILHSHPDLAAALSRKVMDRRVHLENIRADAVQEEEKSVLSRIRDYFGL